MLMSGFSKLNDCVASSSAIKVPPEEAHDISEAPSLFFLYFQLQPSVVFGTSASLPTPSSQDSLNG